MNMRRSVASVLGGLLTAGLLVALTVAPANAYADHDEYYYPGARYLQANVWIGTTMPFGYQTSTKYLGAGGASKATSITNTARLSVAGVAVSLGNASGGTQSAADFATTWTNYNTWISDRAGTNSVAGAWLYIDARSDGWANIPYYGSPKTVGINVQRWL